MNIIHLPTHRRPRQSKRTPSQHRSNWPTMRIDKATIVSAAVIAVTLAAVVLALYWLSKADKANARDPETQCLVSGKVPLAVLVAVDQTDPLAKAAGDRFSAIMDVIKHKIPRGGRLIIVPFNGDLGTVPIPTFDQCSPGQADEAENAEGSIRLQRQYDRKFSQKVDEVAKSLQNDQSTGYSPIAQQLERIVTDPAIAWHGERCELYLVSDGLQSTAGANIYKGEKMRFPSPVSGMFRHCEVHYFELANPKRFDLQTGASRAALDQWLTANGTRPKMHAPGYAGQPSN
jgi:hypothetical protein